ncbi:hypothetical protein HPB49_009273 [Dermacentor silvarum]|uniref:Uncharacterized protein n=1 Tax=Dermacentor silvarum TaxID=543639 RepID=A0ACB8C8M5_DERSI|nr:hypothetical protein HPB49_009273 [Dermacentor silvarum]
MRAIVYPVTDGSTVVEGWDVPVIFSNNCAFTVVVYVAGHSLAHESAHHHIICSKLSHEGSSPSRYITLPLSDGVVSSARTVMTPRHTSPLSLTWPGEERSQISR